MTVCIVDRRRKNDPFKVCDVELPNGHWFEILDLVRVGNLINNQHTNDEIVATKAKARLLAKVIEIDFNPDTEQKKQMKSVVVEFLKDCNGFRTR